MVDNDEPSICPVAVYFMQIQRITSGNNVSC